jgi:hypothetical protein
MEKSDRRKILILSFALVVVMLGVGIVYPIFPFYIKELGASGTELGLPQLPPPCWSLSLLRYGVAFQIGLAASPF